MFGLPPLPDPTSPKIKKIARTFPGFQNLQWGVSKAVALEAAGKKYQLQGVVPDGHDELAVFRGDFAGYENCQIAYYFHQDKLFLVGIGVYSQNGLSSVDIFDDLRDKYTNVYGMPNRRTLEYYSGKVSVDLKENPTHDEALRWRETVLGGLAEYSAVWSFDNSTVVAVGTQKFEKGIRNLIVYEDANVMKERQREELKDI